MIRRESGDLSLTGRSFLATLQAMRQPSRHQREWLVRRRGVAIVALVVGVGFGLLRIRNASSEPMGVDGAPSGMVTFVGGGSCPPGWIHISDLEGKAIVGTVIKEDVGIDVGLPFTDREKRVHQHDYTVDINLPAKFLFGSNGPNDTAALAKLYSVTDVTAESASEVPFFQMEACVKP